MKLRALLYGAALALSNLLLPAPQAQAVTPHHVPPAACTIQGRGAQVMCGSAAWARERKSRG